MKQKFSDKATVMIQGATTILLSIATWWGLHTFGLVPRYTGLLGVVVGVVILVGVVFVVMSVVGAVMWVLNLIFYYIQLARHGPPSAQIEE
ncbi:MAG: hypothetical protein ABEI52_00985 [Halobacteriaceae archaeon]